LTLDEVAAGGKRALAAALAEIEARPNDPGTAALLDSAFARPRGLALGLTGPPGAGKSTLSGALIRHWRAQGATVGVVAVDPSSAGSGGALLGDRTRLCTDPGDAGVFVRSLAAREGQGGLAAAAFPSMVLMRALFDRVILETVGVGQSETAVAGLADIVLLCVPPGAGDTVQHMKAGVLEVPDVIALTKADLGAPAARTRAELTAALSMAARQPPVVPCAAPAGEGLAALAEALDAAAARLPAARERHRAQANRWAEQQLARRFGLEALRRIREKSVDIPAESPFSGLQRLDTRLSAAVAAAFP
jgi:LAO/AO transport system kinase